MRYVVVLLICLSFASPASAVLLYATPKRNLAAPTGTYANSGWQWQGELGGWNGTAISKKYFITAGHIGNSAVGQNFTFNGAKHRITDVWDDPNSDLRVYKVVGTFSSWAPLYTGSKEVGQSATIFGRGAPRADAVYVGRSAKGWKWGAQDNRQSWGTNVISSVANGGAGTGSLLAMNFDEKGPAYEGALSNGDSGGGVFVKDGSTWRLAGVNNASDGLWSLTKNGATFQASIFDRGGLYAQNLGFAADKSANIPSASYATRISSNMTWINGVLSGTIAPGIPPQAGGNGVPEPASAATLLIFSFASLAQRRVRRTCCN